LLANPPLAKMTTPGEWIHELATQPLKTKGDY
jgi:hypothetical protein